MTRQHLLDILLFSGLWGLSEALLGGWMYARGLNTAAGPVLAIIAFAILTAGRVAVPLPGSSAAIGALAMLYKFLNEPFFACHLLAIFLLGASYDLFFSIFRGRRPYLLAAAATYAGFAAFAVLMTYVFRYEFWAAEGLGKVQAYVGVSGSAAAVANALVVPLTAHLCRRIRRLPQGGAARAAWLSPATFAGASALWILAVVRGQF